jgi:hypothetical protein
MYRIRKTEKEAKDSRIRRRRRRRRLWRCLYCSNHVILLKRSLIAPARVELTNAYLVNDD